MMITDNIAPVAPTLSTSRFRILLLLPATANPHHPPPFALSAYKIRILPLPYMQVWRVRGARDGSDDDDAGKPFVVPVPPLLLPFLLPRPSIVPCCESIRTRRTLALLFFQKPDARLCAAIAAPPKFRAPILHLEFLRDMSWKMHFHFYHVESEFFESCLTQSPLILVLVSGSWCRCVHRVLGAFDIRCRSWL